MEQKKCRFCNAVLTKSFVDLGRTPLANSFLNQDSLSSREPNFPLHALVCTKCLLVQLEEFSSPKDIFADYAYFSSYSETWLKHVENYVNMMITTFGFDKSTQIVEIASNDGYLLQYFKKRNIPVLGIEPASNIAKVAKKKGIPTINKFFGEKTAKELVRDGIQADLLVGNNVIAHVPDLRDFMKGMKILLKSHGVITMEFPHLLQLIKQKQFDTIYHEHFYYFSFFTVQKIFSYYGFSIFDVEELPTHGGSLRISARHYEDDRLRISNRINQLLLKEKNFGLLKLETYENFSKQVKIVKQILIEFLIDVKKQSKKVVCYGAPAKGNTLLNYCGVGIEFIDYTVDLNPHKQGLYLPGTHIPIKNPKIIQETKPDYLLILPWNLRDEIMTQMSYIRNWGGKFVVPIPEVKIYS